MNHGTNIHIEKVSGSVIFNQQQIGNSVGYDYALSKQRSKKKSIKVIASWIGFVSAILSIAGFFGYHMRLQESTPLTQEAKYLKNNSVFVGSANPSSSTSLFNVTEPPLTQKDFLAIDKETRMKIYTATIQAKEQQGLQNIFNKEMDAYNLLPYKYKNIVFVNYEDSYTKIQRLDSLFLTLKIRKL